MATAIILAGGKGTRLKPYTVAIPKPLVPIGEIPISEILLRQLKSCGFKDVILAVNHQAEILRAFFQDGSRWGLNIRYSLEAMPLGTMGPLKLIEDLPENFLVMNGDVLTDLDFGSFLKQHETSDSRFTIASYLRSEKVDFGVLHAADGRLTHFEEKPMREALVSMGVYAVNKDVLNHIPAQQAFGFDDLMLQFLGSNVPVNIHRHEGFWLDIGRPDDYQSAVEAWDQLQESNPAFSVTS